MKQIPILGCGSCSKSLENAALYLLKPPHLQAIIAWYKTIFAKYTESYLQDIGEADAKRMVFKKRHPADGRGEFREFCCISADGTLNGLQPFAERLPTVLAPKTIDNDLGLNYPSEPDEYVRANDAAAKGGYRYKCTELHTQI